MMPYCEFELTNHEQEEELQNAVQECLTQLTDAEQKIIYGVFYDRLTYEDLTSVAGVKAKSHAWKKTKTALHNLKTIMEQHPELQKFIGENNDRLNKPKTTSKRT